MFFNSEQQAEDKLIILYVLDKIKEPLTREQIALIVVENLQIGYFDIQLYIDDLIKDQFISFLKYEEKSLLVLSDVGKETLGLFSKKLPLYTTNMLDLYLNENREKIFKEVQVMANYQKLSDTNYRVELKIHENNIALMEIAVNAPTLKLALDLCNRWKKNTQEIYFSVLNVLI